ncbi:MAG: ABC transporter permease [Chitinivibrionia bacterium]|nr:ABC transporter permease [Chitinivibrionia bacterium]
MNWNQATYLMREAFRTMNRQRAVTIVSVAIMSLSLLILAVFLMITDNMMLLMDRSKDEMKLYVYLDDGLTNEQMNAAYNGIIRMEAVDELVFISKDEAFAEFRAQLGEESELLEALETNPLPASFRVSVKDVYKETATLETLASTIGRLDGVAEVNYGKEFIERFSSITHAVLYVDMVVGLIVILSSLFIIANTVHLAVVSRKETIEILKLVGATNRFITTPFFIEGAFQGGIAALISLAALSAIFGAGRNAVPGLVFFSPDKAVIFVLVCIAMGALGSLAALRRYLRIEIG